MLRDDEPGPRRTRPTPETNEEALPTEPTIRYTDEFRTVIDAIEEGADASGEVPINSFIEQYVDDDTLITDSRSKATRRSHRSSRGPEAER